MKNLVRALLFRGGEWSWRRPTVWAVTFPVVVWLIYIGRGEHVWPLVTLASLFFTGDSAEAVSRRWVLPRSPASAGDVHVPPSLRSSS